MRRKKWTYEQIIEVLKAAEVPGASIKEVCRIYGVAPACFFRWRNKYEGLEACEARRLKDLEDENRRLKQILVSRDLELDAVQKLLRKNSQWHSNGGRP